MGSYVLNVAAVYRTIRNHILAERRAPFAILLIVCAWLYGGYLKETYIGGDYIPPVSLALNFKLALEHGQLPPRLVETARVLYPGGGSTDGIPPVSDMPVFQYYGFLTSALAYPFLIAGIKSARAVGGGMMVAFLMGAAALYFAALSLGAPRRGAFLVSWSYILSPWLISNVYARGGAGEAESHAVLPLLVLGFSWAWTSRYRAAILAIGAGIFALTLSHNIFFFYGVVLCALVCIFNFVGTLWIQKPQCWRAIITCAAAPSAIGIGVLLGMALSAWQWIPVLLSLSQAQFSVSGVAAIKSVSDLAFGLTQAFPPYYFTIGWWTIPSIFVAVLWSRREQRQYAAALAATFAVFFLLAYQPQFIIPHLPGAFAVAQFTSRFLAFLSLIGAFSLSLLRRWPSVPVTVGIGVVIFASEIPVMYTLSPVTNFTEAQLVKAGETNYISWEPGFVDRHFRMPDGWLKPDTRIYVDRWREITRAPTGPIYLRVAGRAFEGMGSFALQVGSPNEEHPLVSVQIDHPEFDVTFTIENPPSQLQLQASHYIVVNGENYSTFIRPDRVYLIEGPPGRYIYADVVDRVETKGLRRVFKVKNAPAILSRQTKSDDFVVELPMAYSPFLVARQQEKAISGWADFNLRLNVRTPNLTTPIVVTYEIPTWIWLLSASGLMVALALVVYPRQKLQ